MKFKLLLSIVTVSLLTACSSVYKTGQTPDDVYYSPAKVVKEDEDKKKEDYTTQVDDNYLRMKVRNHTRWSTIDDYDYWHDTRYDYSCHCTCNNYYGYSPYIKTGYMWNGWYTYTPFNSPYYTIKNQVVRNTSGSNVKAYQNHTYNNTNLGGLVKQIFTNTSTTNNSSSSTDRPSRTFETGTKTSSNAGGNSGGYKSTGSSTTTGRSGRN